MLFGFVRFLGWASDPSRSSPSLPFHFISGSPDLPKMSMMLFLGAQGAGAPDNSKWPVSL